MKEIHEAPQKPQLEPSGGQKVKLLQLAMKPMFFLLVLVLCISPSMGERCRNEPRCECKWYSGKRTVDCSNAGLTSIPTTLDPETQALVLDSNNLGRLEKDAFKSANLLNLQKISLRACHVLEIHENAFRDLKILMELDISANNLTKLQPKTFDGNDALQTIKVAQNPLRALMAYQFPPLKNLKTLDFSQCELGAIDTKAFQNLGHGVESILLNNNRLRSVSAEAFVPLANLKTLHLHDNPWDCDCKLKSFRDFVVFRKLFNRPTSCAEPARLHGKMWSEIDTRDFACKPQIELPFEYVFGSPGRNATLSCFVTGSPLPQVRWVVKGRIVNNNTSPVAFSEQKWILHQESHSIHQWYNLTITNAGYDNLGDYVCVAENNGGVMEKTVVLTFDDPSTLNAKGQWSLSPDQWTMVIAAITASLVFIAVIVALICCCCFCRKAKKANKTNSSENGKKAAISAYGDHDQSHQRLLPPTPEDHDHARRNGHCAHNNTTMMHELTELTEMRAHSDNSSHSRASFENYDPDLIHHYKKTSTPLSVSTLMTHPQNGILNGHRVSPTVAANASPFTRSGTLPLHYHHNHPRSISCDHNVTASQTLRLTPQPQKMHKQSLQHQQRPGYVTLPRRPRSSWSAPPTRDTTPSPMYASMTMKRTREPIYDGVGPRTSADGSSMGTLPRSASAASNAVKLSLNSPAGPKFALGPYYAPIAEVQEVPASPAVKKPTTASNKAEANMTSSSEITLMEESISSYCEPFGKALVPTASTASNTPTASNRHSTTSAESELEALIVANGAPNNNPANGHGKNNNNKLNGHKLEEDIPPMMPLLPPIMTASVGVTETSFSDLRGGKVPPKTLPKPKVRPLPPPKPAKSALIERPPVMFQDEGADGSEV